MKRKIMLLTVIGGVTAIIWRLAVLNAEMPFRMRVILDNAVDLQLVSLSRKLHSNEFAPQLQGWTMLGGTQILDNQSRAQLKSNVYDILSHPPALTPKCFNPRCALRARYQGRVLDILICFDCLRARMYLGDEVVTRDISGAHRKDFDKLMSDANLLQASH